VMRRIRNRIAHDAPEIAGSESDETSELVRQILL
jgi:hypothetical protein